MTTPDFKPSDVVLHPGAPLVATFGKAEREQAAALIVLALAELGDEWRSITNKEIMDTFETKARAGESPAFDYARNPFFRPAPSELAAEGFIRRTGAGDEGGTIEFTEKGIEAMRRWARPAEPRVLQ